MCVHTEVAINAAAICLSTNQTNTINILRAKCRHDIIVVDTMDTGLSASDLPNKKVIKRRRIS